MDMMHGDVLDPAAHPALVSSDRSSVASSALLPMATEQLLLAPAEYSGEHGTCVCGRVVILRGPVVMQERDAAKGGEGSSPSPESLRSTSGNAGSSHNPYLLHSGSRGGQQGRREESGSRRRVGASGRGDDDAHEDRAATVARDTLSEPHSPGTPTGPPGSPGAYVYDEHPELPAPTFAHPGSCCLKHYQERGPSEEPWGSPETYASKQEVWKKIHTLGKWSKSQRNRHKLTRLAGVVARDPYDSKLLDRCTTILGPLRGEELWAWVQENRVVLAEPEVQIELEERARERRGRAEPESPGVQVELAELAKGRRVRDEPAPPPPMQEPPASSSERSSPAQRLLRARKTL